MQTFSFNKSLITDHNAEGYDSVDSEDFDAGYGCVVPDVAVVPQPPAMVRQLTDNEKWAAWYMMLTEAQLAAMDDEHLKRYGIC